VLGCRRRKALFNGAADETADAQPANHCRERALPQTYGPAWVSVCGCCFPIVSIPRTSVWTESLLRVCQSSTEDCLAGVTGRLHCCPHTYSRWLCTQAVDMSTMLRYLGPPVAANTNHLHKFATATIGAFSGCGKQG
jgi:hypothetical protein